jgi:hypothetical protein
MANKGKIHHKLDTIVSLSVNGTNIIFYQLVIQGAKGAGFTLVKVGDGDRTVLQLRKPRSKAKRRYDPEEKLGEEGFEIFQSPSTRSNLKQVQNPEAKLDHAMGTVLKKLGVCRPGKDIDTAKLLKILEDALAARRQRHSKSRRRHLPGLSH